MLYVPVVTQGARARGLCTLCFRPSPERLRGCRMAQRRALWLFPIGAWLLWYHLPLHLLALLPRIKGELLPGLPLLAMADWAVTELNKNKSFAENV